jgi:hypothetical protein
LPAVTIADRVSSMLVAMAAAFGACVAWRQGMTGVALSCGGMGGALVAARQLLWRRDRRGPDRWLECTPDGALNLCRTGQEPMRVRLGPSTRLLGASLFVEVRHGHAAGAKRTRCWLTPLDLPREVLRRWSIVLLARGRVART